MRFTQDAVFSTRNAGLTTLAPLRVLANFSNAIADKGLKMRIFLLVTVTCTLLTNSCFATPFVSGEITESLRRKTTWSVYDEFAIDNPLPSSGEFTYVYNVENVGTTPINLWEFGLSVNPNDLSSTEISGGGLQPTEISPGLWQWWRNNGPPLTLESGERSIDLVVTSSLAPGPILASIYGCIPLTCFIGVTEIIGPAVPEPATWLLAACLFSSMAFQRRRTHI